MKPTYQSVLKLFICLSVIYLICLLPNQVLAQYPIRTEIAHNDIILRMEVNKVTDQSFKLTLVNVVGGSVKFKSESHQLINDWNEAIYNTMIPVLVKGLFEDENDYIGWVDKAEVEKKLKNTFVTLDTKKKRSSPEYIQLPNYGLTETDITNFQVKTERLRAVHDSMIKAGLEDEKLYEKFNKERKLLRKELRAINARRKFVSSLVGNSNVVASFRTIERSEINAGFGMMARKAGFADFIGILTVAETNDALETDNKELFGQSILVPGVSKFSLLTSYRSYTLFRNTRRPFFKKLGIGADINITPYQWKYNIDSNTVSANVVPFAVNLVLPYTWILESTADKHFMISTEAGLAVRYIGGSIKKDEIKTFLGNEKRGYWGPVLGINIQYNALRAQFHAPLLITNKQVAGLTNGQVYASIGIVGSLISDLAGVIKDKQ